MGYNRNFWDNAEISLVVGGLACILSEILRSLKESNGAFEWDFVIIIHDVWSVRATKYALIFRGPILVEQTFALMRHWMLVRQN